jgi:hypothetical protein
MRPAGCGRRHDADTLAHPDHRFARRRRAARNYQLLLKVKPAAAKRFTSLADAERMDFGEFLEHMLEVYDDASRKREKDL